MTTHFTVHGLRMNAILSSLPLMLILLSGTGCKETPGTVDPPPTVTDDDSLSLPGWTLVWNDEFSGPSIDLSKWGHEVNDNGGGNNESQYYTARPENSFIRDGALVIRAIKEQYLTREYTSARMRTANRGDWTYGRFEIRAKLPYGQGIWPAIWMLPTDWEYGGWPASGEIDIMECLGHETWKVYGTIHYGSSPQAHQQTGGSMILPQTSGTFAGDFHVFAVEWDSLGFRWFVDSTQYFATSHGAPFDKRFHLLLNVAVGGNWPGYPNEFTTFPQEMVVDYVRVYRKGED